MKRNDDEIRKQQRKLEGVAAPLGDGSENSQLLQKLLYESYQGRSTVPVASSTGFPGISVNFRKDTPKLKIDTPDRRDPRTDYLLLSLLWLRSFKRRK